MANGNTRANHRYIARIPIGNNSFRYFYSAEDFASYKAQKSGAKEEKAAELKKSKTKRAPILKVPKGHMTTNATGAVVSGYQPGDIKPRGMSNVRWQEYKRLWTTKNTNEEHRVPALKSKSKKRAKLVLSRIRKQK